MKPSFSHRTSQVTRSSFHSLASTSELALRKHWGTTKAWGLEELARKSAEKRETWQKISKCAHSKHGNPPR